MKVNMSFIPLVLLTLASIVCVVLSFPPFDFGFLVYFGLAPLLLALRRSSLRQAVIISFMFGYLHGVGVFQWLPSVDGVELPVFFLLLAPIYSLYYLAFGLSYRLAAARTGRLILIIGPALWVTVEFARANLFFLSLPWNLLGHTQHSFLPVIQIAGITGVYGISFLLVLVNEAGVPWLESVLFLPRDDKRISEEKKFAPLFNAAVAALGLGSVLLYGQMKPGMKSSGGKLRVALVQPNIYLRDNMTFEERSGHLRIYSEFTRKAAEGDPDLIVWPASSLPGPLASRLVKVQIRKLLEDVNIPLLVGGSGAGKMQSQDEKKRQYANSEFLLSLGDRSNTRYHKQRLVPFNEYLPLDEKIRWPPWITTLKNSYKPGTIFTLFQVNGAKFGAPICWESLFPDLFRRFVREGANFMVSVSNEAYMGDTAGPYQSFVMNVFRAVENRVAIVRPSPTGISAIIAPDGRIMDKVQDDGGKELFVSGILVRDIPLSEGKTFYTKHGDVFAFASMAISIVAVLVMTITAILERSGSGS